MAAAEQIIEMVGIKSARTLWRSRKIDGSAGVVEEGGVIYVSGAMVSGIPSISGKVNQGSSRAKWHQGNVYCERFLVVVALGSLRIERWLPRMRHKFPLRDGGFSVNSVLVIGFVTTLLQEWNAEGRVSPVNSCLSTEWRPKGAAPNPGTAARLFRSDACAKIPFIDPGDKPVPASEDQNDDPMTEYSRLCLNLHKLANGEQRSICPDCEPQKFVYQDDFSRDLVTKTYALLVAFIPKTRHPLPKNFEWPKDGTMGFVTSQAPDLGVDSLSVYEDIASPPYSDGSQS